MRIAHVVTLITPENAFGGPVRVAVNQLRELRKMGHEVVLYAGYRGYPKPPSDYEGIPVRAFPVRRLVPRTGYAGLWSPGMLVHAAIRRERYDIIHVHLARDLVTMPMALLAGRSPSPLVIQTHGMIDPSEHPLSKPLDAIATRPIFSQADCILYLTEWELDALQRVGAHHSRLRRLVNGVPSQERPSHEEREEVDILFVGRLQAVKRPQVFVAAALQLLASYPHATFSLVGADEGEARSVENMIKEHGASARIRWEGPLPADQVNTRIARSDIFVLASAHDTFPMAVLEASAMGLPSVVTEGCGLAGDLTDYAAGLVTSPSATGLSNGIARLLESKDLRSKMGKNARAMVRDLFTIAAISERLDSLYAEVVAQSGLMQGAARK